MDTPVRFPQDLDEIGGALADGDYLPLVDVSDTSTSAAGRLRKILLSRIKTWLLASTDLGENLADDDVAMLGNTSGSSAFRSFALSRIKDWLLASAELGEAIADDDELLIGNTSGAGAFRTLTASRLYDYVLSKVPIAIGTWTPAYSSETNVTATANNMSRYLRIGSAFAFTSNFTSTRNSATVEKSFVMTMPSFVSGNFAASTDLAGVGQMNTSAEATASNIRCVANAGATTAAVTWYDTASTTARTYTIVGLGIVP